MHDDDAADLAELLKQSSWTNYLVQKGQNLDFIFRTQLFVSSTLQPHAYSIYVDAITKSNQLKNPGLLRPNQTIAIPTGPHFGAFHSPITEEQIYIFRAKQLLKEPPEVTQVQFEKDILHSLGRFTGAFGNAKTSKQLARRRKAIISEIIDGRILPANDVEDFPDREAVLLESWANLLSRFRNASSTPYLYEMGNEPVECSASCKRCTSILKIKRRQQGTDEPELWVAESSLPAANNSKLLIADSGADVGARVPVLQRSYPSAFVAASADYSPQNHGTFIYTQLVNSFFGPLSTKDVYVARVAVAKPTDSDPKAMALRMEDVYKSIEDFKSRQSYLNRQGGPAWVVNLSMWGAVEEEDLKYAVLNPSESLLFVAAAGNRGARINMSNFMFTHWDSGVANLLVVGALGQDHLVAGYSNFHENFVDLFVRGSCVCGDARRFVEGEPDTQNQINGTSQATPIAAVAAKILAEKFPAWKAAHIKWRLIATSDLFWKFEDHGRGGELNFPRALRNNADESIIVTTDSPMDVAVNHIDASAAGWSDLLKVDKDGNKVLRVHRLPTCESGMSCFSIMRFQVGWLNGLTKDVVKLKNTTQLAISPRAISKTRRNFVKASELQDLIQPI